MQAATETEAQRAVILDFGHTIVDFALDERALLATYEEARALLVRHLEAEMPSAEDLVERVSRRLARRIDESYGRRELEELDILAEFAKCFAAMSMQVPAALVHQIAALEHRALTAELFLPPANAEALRSIRRDGFRLGLVSNITLLGDLVRDDLHRLGLLDLFDAVILSSELGVRKPHPRIYEAAVEALTISADQAIFVGDRLREDIAGPQAAGMRAILTHEFRVDEQWPGAPTPDAMIERLADLPAAIRGLPPRRGDVNGRGAQ